MTIPIKEHLGTSVLFHVSPIELPDTVEHLLLFRYFNLTKNWNGKNLKDLSSEVLWRANSSQDEYVKVIHGLLFGILVNPEEKMSVYDFLARFVINILLLVLSAGLLMCQRQLDNSSGATQIFHLFKVSESKTRSSRAVILACGQTHILERAWL